MKSKYIYSFSASFFLLLAGALLAQREGGAFSNLPEIFSGTTQTKGGTVSIDRNARFKSKEVLVKFKENAGESVKTYAASSLGGRIAENLSHNGLSKVALPEGKSIEEAVQEYSNHPDVEFAQPNYVYHTTGTPNDALFTTLWGLKNTGQTIVSGTYNPSTAPSNNPGSSGSDMDAVNAWDVNHDCTNTVVAVVDTGANYNHVDLNANIWTSGSCVSETGASLGACPYGGWDYVDGDNSPMDLNGHGTHVAGTIAAVGSNTVGTTGLCWTAQLMPVRALDDWGSGYTADIVKGINFAVRNGAKVVNLSLGGPSYDPALRSAIALAGINQDVLFVVAAGNETSNLASKNSFPCKFPEANILCVAALDQAYSLASFSNFDTSSVWVDIGAPGTNIRSTWAGREVSEVDSNFGFWTTNSNNATDSKSIWTATSKGSCIIGLYALYLSTSCLDGANGEIVNGYLNNITTTAYKTYTYLSGMDRVHASFYLFLDTEPLYDVFSLNYSNSAGLPSFSGAVLDSYAGEMNGNYAYLQYQLPNCTGSSTNCSFGFKFNSNSSIAKAGIVIAGFEFSALDVDDTAQYNILNGTSMATPHVAGLAALLRSFNPKFTYQDTIDAIVSGGRTTSSLQGKTKYGKAADANGALRFLKAPSSLTLVAP